MKIRKLAKEEFPRALLEIPDPPKQLFAVGKIPEAWRGSFESLGPRAAGGAAVKTLCVVGARHYTDYGRDVCEKLIKSLSGLPVIIVSGLALGIDSIAHRAALDAKLTTVAFPGSGLDPSVLYPRLHAHLAEKIVQAGGALISEFNPKFRATQYSFPQRNRLMAAVSDATLIIEAERKSGTLITSRLAADYNKDVLAVPGSIFSKNTEGPHLLIRIGATPITSEKDLHEALGFETKNTAIADYSDCSDEEKEILKILRDPLPRDELSRRLEKPPHEVSILLSLLEMKGHIKESLGLVRLIN